MLAGFAVCRGRYYSPSGSSCKCAAVTGIAEPGAGIEAAGDAHLCVPPETKDSHRVPLGPFSADSAPADLCPRWSYWSLGSCIFGWGAESETASLHLHPSLPLQPSVERKCLSQHKGAGTETPANLRRAPGCTAPSGRALRRRCLKHPELLPPQQGHMSSGVIRVTCQRSGAVLLLSIPPHLLEEFGISSWKPKLTLSQSWDEGFCR